MKEAYQLIEKEFILKKVKDFQQVAKDLINGKLIIPNTPKKVKQPKFLGLLKEK